MVGVASCVNFATTSSDTLMALLLRRPDRTARLCAVAGKSYRSRTQFTTDGACMPAIRFLLATAPALWLLAATAGPAAAATCADRPVTRARRSLALRGAGEGQGARQLARQGARAAGARRRLRRLEQGAGGRLPLQRRRTGSTSAWPLPSPAGISFPRGKARCAALLSSRKTRGPRRAIEVQRSPPRVYPGPRASGRCARPGPGPWVPARGLRPWPG